MFQLLSRNFTFFVVRVDVEAATSRSPHELYFCAMFFCFWTIKPPMCAFLFGDAEHMCVQVAATSSRSSFADSKERFLMMENVEALCVRLRIDRFIIRRIACDFYFLRTCQVEICRRPPTDIFRMCKFSGETWNSRFLKICFSLSRWCFKNIFVSHLPVESAFALLFSLAKYSEI